ncbi:hypothetical protein J3R82DRAFT_11054 [Butyriboletus roseoflavus]|nr:hypothetical protein J3R82DRAFT_11054 [Butyriboletus roseoflavus]
MKVCRLSFKVVCAHYDLPVRFVHLNGQEMCYNKDDAISDKTTTTTKGYDLDELVSKKHARCTLQYDSDLKDNDETDEALSDMEHQQVEEVKIHGPVKDESMDVNMPAPKLPALGLQPATTGSEILETAIEVYCAILLTETPFPTATQEVEWAKAAWEIAHQHHDSNLAHDITVLKLIMARSTHLRGQFRSKA